jgi:translation initiation factor eIF-2B subunit delta
MSTRSTKTANVEPAPAPKADNRLTLFDHLPRKQQINKNIDNVEGDRILHPATIKLGALYSKGTIQADDDRVTALVAAFCNIIQDYKTPPKKVLREDLDKYISKQVRICNESRLCLCYTHI